MRTFADARIDAQPPTLDDIFRHPLEHLRPTQADVLDSPTNAHDAGRDRPAE